MEGGRDGGREGGRVRGKEGEREGGKEGKREGGTEGGREGGRGLKNIILERCKVRSHIRPPTVHCLRYNDQLHTVLYCVTSLSWSRLHIVC